MHGMDGGMSLGMAVWGLAGALLLLVLLLMVLRLSGVAPGEFGSSLPAESERARRILDERFARGEIDAEEYRKRRQVLGD